MNWAFQVVLVVNNLHASAGDIRDAASIPGSGRKCKKWQPTPVFLPGKSYRQRSLVGLQGHKESDVTERLST